MMMNQPQDPNPGNNENGSDCSPRILYELCPVLNSEIYRVVYPNEDNYCYYYSPKRDQMFIHQCLNCQPIVTELDLIPLYHYYDSTFDDTVLVVENKLSRLIEFYTYSFQTGGFTEVMPPNFVFDPRRIVENSIVATIKSKTSDETLIVWRDNDSLLMDISDKLGNTIGIKPTFVSRLMNQNLDILTNQERENRDTSSYYHRPYPSEYFYVNHALDSYTRTIHSFMWLCEHTNSQCIKLFNVFHHGYSLFSFNDESGRFEKHNCQQCVLHTDEGCLHPKYAERVDDDRLLFHMYNGNTHMMNQFFFNEQTTAFEEVWWPSQFYDPMKDVEGNTIAIIEGDLANYVILRDGTDGVVQKEKFDKWSFTSTLLPPVAPVTMLWRGQQMWARRPITIPYIPDPQVVTIVEYVKRSSREKESGGSQNLNAVESPEVNNSESPESEPPRPESLPESETEDVKAPESQIPKLEKIQGSEVVKAAKSQILKFKKAKNSKVALSPEEVERRRLKNRRKKEKKQAKKDKLAFEDVTLTTKNKSPEDNSIREDSK